MRKKVPKKPRLYFREALRDAEYPHEYGLIVNKKEVDDMISLLKTAAFPEDNPRQRVCILVPGYFEKLNEKGEYVTVDLSPLNLTL